MTKNLETADELVKLTLAASIIVLYVTDVISGPFAAMILVLSIVIFLIYILKFFLKKQD